MKMIRDFRAWRIRRKLRGVMVQLRSARADLEKTKSLTYGFNDKYLEGTEQDRWQVTHAMCEGWNHISDAIDYLRPYSPPQNLMEAIYEIQEMAKLEQVLMAKGMRLGKDSAAQG